MRKIRFSKPTITLILVIVSSSLLVLVHFQSQENKFLKVAVEMDKGCRNDKSDRCLSSAFTTYSTNHSIDESIKVLNSLQKISPQTRSCHNIAHAIATKQIEKDPEHWKELFKSVSVGKCTSGFYHGIIEGRYKYEPELLINSNALDDICLNHMPDSTAKNVCAHAFGHIFLVSTGGDVGKAYQECEASHDYIKDKCFQGLFMENIQKESLSVHEISIVQNWDRDYLKKQTSECNKLTDPAQFECWRSLGIVILSLESNNHQKAQEFCLYNTPTRNAARSCVKEVNGHYAIAKFDQSQVLDKNICKQLEQSGIEYQNCILDTVDFVMYSSLEYKSEIASFCNLLEFRAQEVCFKRIKYNENLSDKQIF